jgi:hypothetical protein
VQLWRVAFESDEGELSNDFCFIHIETAEQAERGAQMAMLHDRSIDRLTFIGN